MIVRLHQAFFAVIDEPDHTPVLNRLPEQRIRLEHHHYFAFNDYPRAVFQRAGVS